MTILTSNSNGGLKVKPVVNDKLALRKHSLCGSDSYTKQVSRISALKKDHHSRPVTHEMARESRHTNNKLV